MVRKGLMIILIGYVSYVVKNLDPESVR